METLIIDYVASIRSANNDQPWLLKGELEFDGTGKVICHRDDIGVDLLCDFDPDKLSLRLVLVTPHHS